MANEENNVEIADCYCQQETIGELVGTNLPIDEIQNYNGAPNERCHNVLDQRKDQVIYDEMDEKLSEYLDAIE